MPISPIVLQRRHAELGRIRLGYKAETQNGGSRPAKLERFRFTSVSERYIRDLAQLYGGEPRTWDNAGIASWEVFTETASIPVYAVKGGLSQWLEFWSGGGCIHRCDGEINVLTGDPCDLDEQVQVGRKKVNPHAEAKPTTRLSLMLPELEAIGVWRMESHGWNAAAEIPAVAELAQFVGDLVPANLHLVERRSIKDGQTSRFVVPVLDLQIGTARLREIVNAKLDGRELEAPQRPAELEAGPVDNPYAEWAVKVGEATDVDELGAIWAEMRDGHELVGPDATPSPQATAFVEVFKARAATLKAAPSPGVQGAEAAPSPAASAPPPTGPDEEGAYDAELVAPDADQVWAQIVATAASRGLTSTPDLQDDCATFLGISAGEASGEELQMYLDELTSRPEVDAA